MRTNFHSTTLQGGPKRIKHTLVPLVFTAIMLARTIKKLEEVSAPPAVASKKVLGEKLSEVSMEK